jgi:ATP-binding cassette subfamily B (MDR/TAP) protein 1
LTQRIRSKAFASLLRQEVAYFDRPENSSGAICVRLSTEAAAIQEMAGTRLGVICEGFSLSCFGLIFGMFISWQLTLIVFIAFLIVAVIVYLDVRLTIWMTQRSDVVLGHTSSVRLDSC